MTMKQHIASAFRHRLCPVNVTAVAVNSTLRADALHFEGKNWAEVTAKDWIEYSDAFYGLSADAFLYFLPSLLVASLEHVNVPLIAADAVVLSLDTSADPDLWTDWFNDRYRKLNLAELSALSDWANVFLANTARGSEFARVQETLGMLSLALES